MEAIVRQAALYGGARKFWWIREEPVGGVADTFLCRAMGGHVRFQTGAMHPPVMIARWSATPRKGYRPMTFQEWQWMQQHGQFPLRVAA